MFKNRLIKIMDLLTWPFAIGISLWSSYCVVNGAQQVFQYAQENSVDYTQACIAAVAAGTCLAIPAILSSAMAAGVWSGVLRDAQEEQKDRWSTAG